MEPIEINELAQAVISTPRARDIVIGRSIIWYNRDGRRILVSPGSCQGELRARVAHNRATGGL